MALNDDDKKAIKRVARLLAADHHGADTKALVLESLMLETASHYRIAGSGASMFWAIAAKSLGKSLIAFAEEQTTLNRLLKIN